MNLPCEIAGWATTWRFRDSGWLERWLSSAPWDLGSPAAQVLRLSDVSYQSEIAIALRRAFVGLTSGDTAARVMDVPVESGETIVTALVRSVGLGDAAGHETMLQLAQDLAQAPMLLIVTGLFRDRPVAEELNSLFDLCSKWHAPPHVGAVILDTIEAPSIGNARDFATGWFADPVMPAVERPGRQLERPPYLALRLAWELGGDYGLVLSESLRWTSVPGDDSTLESDLNAMADRLWNQVSSTLKDSTKTWLLGLQPGMGGKVGRREAGPSDSLREARIVWRPPGHSRWRPTPWVARALLRQRTVEASRPYLRSCLVAAPLANEILRRCFELESLVVARVTARMAETRAPVEAKDLFSAFQTGGISERRLYPADCPATPTNAWHFASFGSVIREGMDSRGSPHARLRNLRNALSHGHYVSWHAVQELLEIEIALQNE